MVSMIVCGYTELNWIAFYSSCDYFSGRGVSLNTDGKIDFFLPVGVFWFIFFNLKLQFLVMQLLQLVNNPEYHDSNQIYWLFVHYWYHTKE